MKPGNRYAVFVRCQILQNRMILRDEFAAVHAAFFSSEEGFLLFQSREGNVYVS